MDPFCKSCHKPPALCLCREIEPLANKIEVLILQHPQEPDKLLGTGHLTANALENAKLKTGLSWKNLSSALGKPATNSEWAILYLGSAKDMKATKRHSTARSGLVFLDKKGNVAPSQESIAQGIRGVIVLDGTWSQVKTLWWRNPWMLKLQRMVLIPTQASLYQKLRREPRKDCLSTLESVAETLELLEKNKSAKKVLLTHFKALLERYENYLLEPR